MDQRYTVLEQDFGGMPQGSDVLEDGRYLTVDVMAGDIVAYSAVTGRETIAHTSSGPIGVVRGDDAFYIAHTGGVLGDFWVADDAVRPCIQRIEFGSDEPQVLIDEVGGEPLIAPHDIAFAADGRLIFTDSHIWEWDAAKRSGGGRIVAIAPDGSAEVLVHTGVTFPCGIAGEPDGSIVWTESYSEKVRRLRPDGAVEEIITLPDGHTPHGIRVAQDGTLWVASFGSSTIDEIAADGSSFVSHDVIGHPMNLAFVGDRIYVSTFKELDDGDMDGRLLAVDANRAGSPVPRGRVQVPGASRPASPNPR